MAIKRGLQHTKICSFWDLKSQNKSYIKLKYLYQNIIFSIIIDHFAHSKNGGINFLIFLLDFYITGLVAIASFPLPCALWAGHISVCTYHKLFNCQGKGGWVEENLSIVRQMGDYVIQHPLKILRQQLVSLQPNQTCPQICRTHFIIKKYL